ncbi:NYN domain-containing protein [Corticibacter populi]|uniref:NYN domain-containing protein n=1 Tax=Corticibacter populi TaxID=1550736 RepID=A0A3M6R068_9BURK|nr:NYN domain-containing protein [Corticibacter populi]RMX08269.1 NYN domain-containing protein [Corticibacter populi]RZS35547.1 NYN domain-containing protein [Corticibacter populi]
MTPNRNNLLRIAVIYDGSFFWRISNYYRFTHNKQSHLNLSALHDYLRHHIAAIETDSRVALCQITEAHFFRGRFSLKAVQATRDPLKQLETDRFQDQVLMWAGVVAHYQPMNEAANPPEEKGVDINLALETYDLVVHKGFDVVVLFTGAADFSPLVRKLQSVGTRVLVPAFDLPNYAKTSQRLLEEAAYSLPFSDLIDKAVDDKYEDLLDAVFR